MPLFLERKYKKRRMKKQKVYSILERCTHTQEGGGKAGAKIESKKGWLVVAGLKAFTAK